jgi:hypothetical protein
MPESNSSDAKSFSNYKTCTTGRYLSYLMYFKQGAETVVERYDQLRPLIHTHARAHTHTHTHAHTYTYKMWLFNNEIAGGSWLYMLKSITNIQELRLTLLGLANQTTLGYGYVMWRNNLLTSCDHT